MLGYPADQSPQSCQAHPRCNVQPETLFRGSRNRRLKLWRSVKYEEIYLRAYDTVAEARNSLASYFSFYNSRRPHSSLDRQTPDQAYFAPLPQIAAA